MLLPGSGIEAAENSPFRWGMGLVADFPSYEYNGRPLDGASARLGLKARVDWIPRLGWQNGWASGFLEGYVFSGDVLTDRITGREFDFGTELVGRGGIGLHW